MLSSVRTSGLAALPMHSSAALYNFYLNPDHEHGVTTLTNYFDALNKWHTYLYENRLSSDGLVYSIVRPRCGEGARVGATKHRYISPYSSSSSHCPLCNSTLGKVAWRRYHQCWSCCRQKDPNATSQRSCQSPPTLPAAPTFQAQRPTAAASAWRSAPKGTCTSPLQLPASRSPREQQQSVAAHATLTQLSWRPSLC